MSVIDGVRWTSDSIPGVEIVWGDPVDLPLGDEAAALVVLHVPRFDEAGRHHQLTVDAYVGWLGEAIEEASRVLELGGRLVLVLKACEPHLQLDLPSTLADPLDRAGFTTPITYTWCPSGVAVPEPVVGRPDGVDLTAAQPLMPTTTSWRVLVAAKGQSHRAGSILARQELGLPHRSTIPVHLWDVASSEVWVVPVDRAPTQGNLPPLLIAVVQSLFSFVDDLVVNPLCGSGVVADVARQLGRRARCYEPDGRLLERLVASTDAGRLGVRR